MQPFRLVGGEQGRATEVSAAVKQIFKPGEQRVGPVPEELGELEARQLGRVGDGSEGGEITQVAGAVIVDQAQFERVNHRRGQRRIQLEQPVER